MTATGDGKHCAPERRVPRIENSGGLIFVTFCGCYSDDCVQLTTRENGDIGVRKSNQPDQIIWFDRGEFDEFLEVVRDPSRDVIKETIAAFEAGEQPGDVKPG